jgi:pilus assembly protein CpaF
MHGGVLMLGQKRNASLFTPQETASAKETVPPQETPPIQEKASVPEPETADPMQAEKAFPPPGGFEDIPLGAAGHGQDDEDDDLPKRSLDLQDASALRSRGLFFAPESGSREFGLVLADVQEYVSSKYSALITDKSSGDTKAQIKRYIAKYVQDRRIAVKGLEGQSLVDALYTEMAEFGFLTKYIFGAGIEEINVNSWRDVEVLYAGGQLVKLDEHFDSPDHAVNVIRRMLHISGMVLDNASPAVLGHLSKNIRIAVLKTPLVDEDVGICASIRIVNPQSMKKEDFVRGGTATEDMMDFLSECIRYGISVCIAGSTGSGKTTVAGWLLTTIPYSKRIFTIENGSRELDLVRERDGRVANSVIHTITRESENENQSIDQETLLDMALRFHPDVICVGEMRSWEAYTAQEAARTGHAVLSTVHSNSCEATWRRIVTLCKRKYDMADETLMDLVSEAFPVVVFTKQLENKERKIMEIMECEMLPDGTRRFHTLYRYHISENRMEGGKFVIGGRHEALSPISQGLKKRFLENGMPQGILEKLAGKDGEPA